MPDISPDKLAEVQADLDALCEKHQVNITPTWSLSAEDLKSVVKLSLNVTLKAMEDEVKTAPEAEAPAEPPVEAPTEAEAPKEEPAA